MILTHEMFEAGRSDAGGHNLAQLKALGVPLPARGWPKTGWVRRLIGSTVTLEQYAEFLHLRGNKRERAQREVLPIGIAKDREINFDRPRLKESNVGTAVIADRFIAGESVAQLAEDYGVPMSEIEKALRFEVRLKDRGPSAEDFANGIFEESGRDLS